MAGLNEFARRMRRRGERVETNASRATRRVALVVHQSVVLGTPVDTGTARSNWQPSISGVPASVPRQAFDPGMGGSTVEQNTSAALAEGVAVISRYRGRRGIFISNVLSYIVPLNAGNPNPATAGFVQLAVLAGRNAVRRQRVLE